jgi:hypothetical protein
MPPKTAVFASKSAHRKELESLTAVTIVRTLDHLLPHLDPRDEVIVWHDLTTTTTNVHGRTVVFWETRVAQADSVADTFAIYKPPALRLRYKPGQLTDSLRAHVQQLMSARSADISNRLMRAGFRSTHLYYADLASAHLLPVLER